MSTKFCEEITNNYKKLYETKKGYDMKIYVGEKSNIKEFHVHSFILKTQSEFFEKSFDNIDKKDDYFILNLNNLSPKIFEILLIYMYHGIVDLTKLQSREILNLLLPSYEFKLQPLTTYIQETLINNHDDFIIKNLFEIIELIYQKIFLNKLWNLCIQKFCHYPNYLFESTKFYTLNPSILEILLKQDELNSDEIVIWENLLTWACGQHPPVQQDISKWNKNEFTVMERRLSRFIPLVRFYHISSENFLLKVYPFKELLSNDLVNNILAYHMVPNNKLNINNVQPPRSSCFNSSIIVDSRHSSIIVNSQHLTIFASWIKKKPAYCNFRFELIYRASRDGNTAAAFHEKCDNKGATIVIVKIKDSEQMIGGYNPLQWDSSSVHKSTNDSFIFSFTNRTNIQSAKVGYCINGGQVSGCFPGYGPIFCGGFCQNPNNTWAYYNSSKGYAKINDDIQTSTSSVISVEDCEVFQVIERS